ncbi:MAG: CDP-diacylglycerol--glycerol-3-phosphate 3-phosphatidyltransferase [Planctomycetes bacterium]|nr:CDP-diacylglycerol--glycerol-3-phosphate 3-phosphatidyltransferase [Planctomycetota bacterium]
MGSLGIWNLPNRITLGRLVLSVLLFLILGLMQENVVATFGPWAWVALGLFVLAAGTDWLDGYLARKHGMVTAFGRIMDPFVDKVVVCGTLIFLCTPIAGAPVWIPPWMVVVVIGREFFVSAIRGFMESQGVNFQADMPGKIKMTLQCLAIGGVLLVRALRDEATHTEIAGMSWALSFLDVATPIVIWLALFSTLYSGWYYARKALQGIQGLEG